MKDQIAAEAAEAYYKYEADAWDIYLGHRDKLQAIIKTAIEKALSEQRIYGEWGTAVVIDDEFSSVKGRAAHASEHYLDAPLGPKAVIRASQSADTKRE